MDWIAIPLIVALALSYYAHKNKLNHELKLKEISIKEKEIELEKLKEEKKTTPNKKIQKK